MLMMKEELVDYAMPEANSIGWHDAWVAYDRSILSQIKRGQDRNPAPAFNPIFYEKPLI
jgi:hypothetical protein